MQESKFIVQFGWLARMFHSGFVPSEKTKLYFTQTYRKLLTAANVALKTVVIDDSKEVKVTNIQDRIREKVIS